VHLPVIGGVCVREDRVVAQNKPYEMVLVESYIPNEKSGKHGKAHIRPALEMDIRQIFKLNVRKL
jgi:hypothetical protein